jgi:transcription antitermination factor NusG
MPKVKLSKNLQCGGCWQSFPRKTMSQNENGKWLCGTCYAPAPREAKPEKDLKWYVLQVEPGKESTIRKEIERYKKVHNIEHLVGRCFAPARLEDKMLDTSTELLETEGGFVSAPEARQAGEARLKEFFGEDQWNWEVDGYGVPGYRVTVFPDKGAKGKQANTWKWELRKVIENRRVVTSRTYKYPGYMICNLNFQLPVDAMLTRLQRKGSFGLLLRPVVLGHKVQVTKGRVWYNWKVRHPETGEIIEKGRELDKALAYERAKSAKAKLEEFHPTELASAESAELLIRQKAVNQICQDPTIKNRKILDYKEGDSVRCISGAFKGLLATVTKIDKKDPTDPVVKVSVTILGRPLEVEVKHYEVSK